MAGEQDEVVFEIGADGEAKLLEGGGATTDAPAGNAQQQPITDDPLAGVEDLKRQVEHNENLRRQAEQRASSEQQARMQAEQNAAREQQARIEAERRADSSNYDSIVNTLTLLERELTGLETLKAQALDKGEFDAVAKYDTQMSKVSARAVQLEGAKSQIETARKNAPPQQQQAAPQMTQEQANNDFLNRIPPRTADWVRNHPQFFSDPVFQRKALAAAEYAEATQGVDHTSDRFFQIIEEAVGLRTPQVTSTAAAIQPRQSDTVPPPPPPPPPPAAARPMAPAAAPSRSSPEPQSRSNGNRIVLSAAERDMAHQLHPRLKPSDPDPEVVYAKNKAALIKEGRLQG